MGSMSLMHWLVVLAIVLVLFGAGKLPRVMGDFAKGIKAFKAGMAEEDKPEAAASTPAQVTPPAPTAAAPVVNVAPQPHEHAYPPAPSRIAPITALQGRHGDCCAG